MPIATTDINFYLSGGAANTNANASLGGAISSTAITTNTLNNLFDDVSGSEAAAGLTDYRCIYVRNNHGSLTWQAVTIWIDTNTPSPGDTIDIGLGSSAVGGTEQTVANETTAPTGITFSAPATKATGLLVGDIAAGSWKAIWVRRTVTAGAAAYNSNSVIIKAEGDTNA